MSRTYRSFELLQMLRRRRQPVSGAELAREAGISLRSLDMDMSLFIDCEKMVGNQFEKELGNLKAIAER